MKMRMLSVLAIALLFGGVADAQLADEFNPPRANCCLATFAKSLPINFRTGISWAGITELTSS